MGVIAINHPQGGPWAPQIDMAAPIAGFDRHLSSNGIRYRNPASNVGGMGNHWEKHGKYTGKPMINGG